MHEMSIAVEIVRQAEEVARHHAATRISEIELEVGALRQVVPQALQLAFGSAAEGTLAESAKLTIIEERVIAVCRNCECLFCPEIHDFTCIRCGVADARIVAGNDIILKTVICEAPETATVLS